MMYKAAYLQVVSIPFHRFFSFFSLKFLKVAIFYFTCPYDLITVVDHIIMTGEIKDGYFLKH